MNRLDRVAQSRYDLGMTNNDRNSHAARLARFAAATPTITFPDRPADRSRNGQRTPGSVRHKGMR